MSTMTEQRVINAPKFFVFETIAHIDNYAKAIPHIIEVEVLSDQRSGLGTRFRETRLMGKRKATTVLEVTEYVAPERVRFVSDSGGSVWDTVFVLFENKGQTTLEMTMTANPKNLFAKIMNLLIQGMIAKAVGEDMDAVKRYCEAALA